MGTRGSYSENEEPPPSNSEAEVARLERVFKCRGHTKVSHRDKPNREQLQLGPFHEAAQRSPLPSEDTTCFEDVHEGEGDFLTPGLDGTAEEELKAARRISGRWRGVRIDSAGD